jgi:hypothetical protein
MAARIRQSVAAMANDVDRTSHRVDALIARADALLVAIHELVDVIKHNGISIGAEVAGHEIPGSITLKPNDEGE